MTSRTAHALILALVILSGCAGKPIRRSYEFPGTRKDYPEETVFVSSPKPRVPDKDRLPKELPSFCKLNPEACPDLIEKLAPPKPKPSPSQAKPPTNQSHLLRGSCCRRSVLRSLLRRIFQAAKVTLRGSSCRAIYTGGILGNGRLGVNN